MHESYQDILDAVGGKQPLWYDSGGVPRFAAFTPTMCPDIYSDLVILAKIACQSCGRRFMVEMHRPIYPPNDTPPRDWFYGDPPFHPWREEKDSVCAGATMSSDSLYVVEAWARDRSDWERRPDLEGPMWEEGEDADR